MTERIERTAPKTHREVIAMRLFELQMIGGSRFTYWHLLDQHTRDRWLYTADEVIRMMAPTLRQNETLRARVARYSGHEGSCDCPQCPNRGVL